jgi:hypothetical protein
MNADKDVDTDKLLDSNNKILDSPNNLEKVKSGQKRKSRRRTHHSYVVCIDFSPTTNYYTFLLT